MIFLSVLFAHWIALLDTLQQFFWNYTPRPLLSTVFPNLIEGSPTPSQVTHAPRIRDLLDYSGSVDLATCFVPTILQTPLAMNISCSVDRSDNDLYNASSVEPSHHYVFLNVPVWRPAIPEEDVVPTSPSSRVEDNRTQTSMAPYGAHGLSFCPVLLGIVYIRSLLHLYMLLMDKIPSLCNHWFEDVLIYESLNPTELLDCSWFLHASLCMVPWYLLRCGVRKAVSCLYYIRPLTCKPAYPPIPRIVLTRVDGKSVPVNFTEDDQPSVNAGISSSFEAEESEVDENRDTTSDSREPQDLVKSLGYADGSCSATEFEVPPFLTVSHEDEHHDVAAEAQENIGSGALASGFAKDSQIFVHQIPDKELQISPVLVDSTNEPFQHVEEDSLILPTPEPDTIVEKREFEQMAFLWSDDVRQDDTDGLGERGDSDQDPITFCPWSLIDDPGPDGMETLPKPRARRAHSWNRKSCKLP
ncbi:hypothetical protein JVT61DRAFT_10996 [Boletus reticuloceps]|uniref:Uncharacterized protein n=1 Tax=Boletus reticuloceps TaxID=495285 RepID=A0A8I3A5T0_9AGAM|nr:hypothetical protein JVT61DRAFT_10996 [Boletus reticuloceps]